MPVDADFPNPTIKIVAQGLIISAIKDENPRAEIGALVDSPCHKARLTVKKVMPDGQEKTIHKFDPEARISLKVEKTSRSKTETYKGKEKFVRLAGSGDINDFRWYADIEADWHPDRKYTPKPEKIKPIFDLNNALFYTEDLSSEVIIAQPGSEPKSFGKIAEVIAANVYLDLPESTAVLIVDGEELLFVDESDVKKGIKYTIIFDCLCNVNPSVSDFNTVYKALEPSTPDDEQLVLKTLSSGGGASSPDVICVGTNIASSTSLGE